MSTKPNILQEVAALSMRLSSKYLQSVINPAARRADGGINGKYRSRMTAATLKKKKYGRRWSVEPFMSALKRTTGSMLSARSERALFTEATLRVLAYALRR